MTQTVSLSEQIDLLFIKPPVIHPDEHWYYELQYKWLLHRRDKAKSRSLRPWRLCTSGESSFRQNNYSKKELKKSLNRDRKLKEFRNNDKTPCAFPIGGKARLHAQIEDNRKFRRQARRLLREGRYEEVQTQEDPVNTWKWS